MHLQNRIPTTVAALTLLMASTSVTLAQPRKENRSEQDQRNDRSNALVRRIKSYDKNGDGKVSKAEGSETLRRVYFSRIDTNRDGFIDKAELKKFGEELSQSGNSNQRPRRERRAIVDAPFISAGKVTGQVSDKELVIGVVIDGKSRAYPINMLTGPSREIINDILGGRSIAATW